MYPQISPPALIFIFQDSDSDKAGSVKSMLFPKDVEKAILSLLSLH